MESAYLNTIRNTDRRDFNYFVGTLYKTEDDEYFLYGRVSPNIKYGRRVNGERTGSEELVVPDEGKKRSIDREIVVQEFAHLIET